MKVSLRPKEKLSPILNFKLNKVRIVNKPLLIALLFCCWLNAQKRENFKDIMTTNDIAKIERFLATIHPDDSRKQILRSKVIALKNKRWTEGAKNAKPMEIRPIVTEVPTSVMRKPNSEEAEEFRKLIAESSDAHQQRTVKLLNTLFDQDITRKEAIILVQNNSDCNMIVRINNGKEFYNLAVPFKGENSIVVNKGKYTFDSNICGIKYNSVKEVAKNMIVVLNRTN